jgi:hypothetical protein
MYESCCYDNARPEILRDEECKGWYTHAFRSSRSNGEENTCVMASAVVLE